MADPAPKQTPAQIAAANAAAEKASAAAASTYGKLPAAPTTGGRPASSLAPAPTRTPVATPASMDPTDLRQWAADILAQLPGAAPVTNPNTDPRVNFLINWASVEGTYGTTNPNNPLDITGGYNKPSGQLNSVGVDLYSSFQAGAGALDDFLKQSSDAPILKALQTGTSTTQELGNALAQSNWTGNGAAADLSYAQEVVNSSGAGSATPGVTLTGSGGLSTDQTPKVQSGSFLPSQPNVDITNFHGYDLSSFVGGNELGNAEHAIEQFSNPDAKDAQGMNLQQRIEADYGYTVGWALQHPEVGAVLIWAAAYADPSTAAGKAAGLSQLQKTQWYQTTSSNKRAFEAGQSTDPAEVAQSVKDAVDKVEATANQIGVTLTPKQAQAIGKAYAEQSYTPQGALGTSSGTSQEQLDQMVISAVTTVQKTGALPGVDTTATFNAGAEPATSPTGTGIASQLFESLKGIAQQYMMYSSSPSSPITDADLNKYVASYLQQYTGTGSYGSSNLMNGANQSFTEQMQTMASQMYPTLAPVIKMGTAPATYTAPIQNLITNTMGLTQGSVDLTSPQWNWAIKADPTTGATLSQDQILQKLTAMPAYQQTANAKNTAHTVINGMASMFGTGGV